MKANKPPLLPCNNVSPSFGAPRDYREFTDVNLACEDGELKQAHKVVPAPTNPFSKSKQASSSIDLGWGVCSSAKRSILIGTLTSLDFA